MKYKYLCKLWTNDDEVRSFRKKEAESKNVPRYQEIELWKSLWKLWITHCKELLLKELCKYREEKRETSGKVEESALSGDFCQFSDEKIDVHFVEKKKKRKNSIGLFCKRESGNTICIIPAARAFFRKMLHHNKKFLRRCWRSTFFVLQYTSRLKSAYSLV